MFKKIKCILGFHSFQEVGKLSKQCVKLSCTNCNREFAYHHVMRLLTEFDVSTEKFYESFNQIEKEQDKQQAESEYIRMKSEVV